MRRTWRTIRQRSRRSRSGQVSAVATIFALLLLVSFMSTFIFGQLGNQMAQKEFQHQVQVENQMAELQMALLRAASVTQDTIYLSSPVTLGSGAVPPFGTPSSGYLMQEPLDTSISASLGMANITRANLNWSNIWNACGNGGSGVCTNKLVFENFSATSTECPSMTCNLKITGVQAGVVYNISGPNNGTTPADNYTFNINIGGTNNGYIYIILNGSYDHVNILVSGSSNSVPAVTLYVFGSHDIVTNSVSGGSSIHGSITFFNEFVGILGVLCPYGDASQSDTVSAFPTQGTNVNDNVTWWNNAGIISAPHTVSTSVGNITWQNKSGFYQCPFTQAATSGPYDLHYLSGLRAHLNNRYLPPADVTLEQGAVIFSVQNGGSVMLDPPPVKILVNDFGLSVSLTLMSIVGNSSIATGVTTAAVTSHVLSVSTFHILNGQQGHLFLTHLNLSITTAYPQAWYTYWNGQTQIVPGGAVCIPGPGVPSSQCLTPPSGRTSTIEVPFVVSELTLVTIVGQVSIY
jgi:hypothetical protein